MRSSDDAARNVLNCVDRRRVVCRHVYQWVVQLVVHVGHDVDVSHGWTELKQSIDNRSV